MVIKDNKSNIKVYKEEVKETNLKILFSLSTSIWLSCSGINSLLG